MKKTALLVSAFLMCFGLAQQASANEGEKIACEKTHGEWHPFAGVPKCDCSKHQELFPLLAPGGDPKLVAIRNRAQVSADVCENRVMAQTSPNIRKGKDKGERPAVVPAPAPPANIVYQVIPDPVSQDSAQPAKMTVLVTSGLSRVIGGWVTITCDFGCNVNDTHVSVQQAQFSMGSPRHDFSVTSTGRSTGTVTVSLSAKGNTPAPEPEPRTATVQWITKELPPSPAKIACQNSRGTFGTDPKLPGFNRCSCVGDYELAPSGDICVAKMRPTEVATATVEETGTIVHPTVAGLC